MYQSFLLYAHLLLQQLECNVSFSSMTFMSQQSQYTFFLFSNLKSSPNVLKFLSWQKKSNQNCIRFKCEFSFTKIGINELWFMNVIKLLSCSDFQVYNEYELILVQCTIFIPPENFSKGIKVEHWYKLG